MAISSFNKTGEDYTSLAAWEADTDNDLVTAAEGETLEIYADDGVVSPPFFNPSGATTDSTYHREIRSATEDRHVGVWDTAKTILDFTAVTGDHAIALGENYFNVRYLQIIPQNNTGKYAIYGSSGSGGDISHNLIDLNAQSRGIRMRNTTGRCYRNNVYDSASTYGGIYVAVAATHIKCNTIYGGTYGIRGDSSGLIIESNLCLGQITQSYFGSFDQTNSRYNLGGDTTAPGINELDSRTATANTSPGAGDWVIFNNITAGSEDLRLHDNATDNDAQDAGVDLGSPYDVDIAGNAVTGTWDIGAFEVVAAGDTVTPGLVGANISSQSPTISAGAVTLAPGVVGISLSPATPTIAPGSATASPSVVSPGLSLISPTLSVPGVITVSNTSNVVGAKSFTHTIAAGDDFVVVAVGLEVATPDVTAVTIGGNAMTEIVSAVEDINLMSIWFIKSAEMPASGSQTVSITNNDDAAGTVASAISGSGAAQASPEAFDTTTLPTTSTSISTTISGLTDGALVIDGVCLAFANRSPVADAGQTDIFVHDADGPGLSYGSSYEILSGSSATLGWTYTSNPRTVQAVISIAPAGGATTLTPGLAALNAAILAPSTVNGVVTASPSVAGVAASVQASVVEQIIALSPDVVWAAVSPITSAIDSDIILFPGVAGAAISPALSSVISGIVVTTSVIGIDTSAQQVFVEAGSIAAVPGVIGVLAGAQTPIILTGGAAVLTPSAVGAFAATQSPTIAPGGAIISATALSVLAAAPNIILAAGGVVAAAGVMGVTTSVRLQALLPGGAALSPSAVQVLAGLQAMLAVSDEIVLPDQLSIAGSVPVWNVAVGLLVMPNTAIITYNLLLPAIANNPHIDQGGGPGTTRLTLLTDLSSFTDPNEFGVTVLIDGLPVNGVFDHAHVLVPGGAVGVSSVSPIVQVSDADITNVVFDSDLVWGARQYKVVDIQPDGTGMTMLVLKRTV